MNSSDRLDELAASLYAAQREMRNPPKNTDGAMKGGKTLRYADLPSILDHIRPHLDAVSLAVVQDVRGDGLYTLVTHSSGQWLELGPYPLAGGDDQARGSSITYGRRATLAALFRIAADEADPDQESATSSPSQQEAPADSGRDGGAEAVGAGSGAAPAAPTDAQRWMQEYHPGKPHKMRVSPNVPSLSYCAQDTIGAASCPYSTAVKAPA